MRILMLGGTRWIGPHFVNAALSRGHTVAVFNRGSANDVLPAAVERLTGDRNSDLDAIRGRDWDSVIDLAAYGPGWVRSLGEALRGRVGHYTFISSMAVYANPSSASELTEDSPVVAYTDLEDPYVMESMNARLRDKEYYGALKVLCERESETQFRGRTLVLRCGHIVGPGSEPTASFRYLVERLARGGDVAVAGPPTKPVQVIDVRDVAASAVRMIENSVAGIYNVTGPTRATTFAELVEATALAPTRPKITWIESSFVTGRSDRTDWQRLLFWTDEPEGWANCMKMRIERAVANGLVTRPLADTARDTLRWHQGIPDKRQREILPSWAAEHVSLGRAWDAYLAKERQLLSDWRRTSQ